MRFEMRIIKASLFAGLTDLFLGTVLVLTGYSDWWFNTFHLFGMLGAGMVFYAGWHYLLMKLDKKEVKEF